MKLSEVKRLVKKGESSELEFKKSTAGLKEGMKTVCAFLNKNGGSILFGVTDSGKIVGQKVVEKNINEINGCIRKFEPQIDIDIDVIPLEKDLEIIAISVEPGKHKPYMFDGRAYARPHSETFHMKPEEFYYLFNQTNHTLWEKSTVNDCVLIDLDKNKIKELVRVAISKKRLPESATDETLVNILKKLNLIKDDKITNAAVILFCKNERKQFIQTNLKLARFKGIDKSEFLDEKQLTGNLFDLFDQAMQFLYVHIPVAAKIEEGKVERVETPAIPYKVLREAVINALIHRDYSHPGGSIAIAVYNDRVNISNIGSLLAGVTINQLNKEHRSVLRNPLIANACYLKALIERWGRGTLDIFALSKSVGM